MARGAAPPAAPAPRLVLPSPTATAAELPPQLTGVVLWSTGNEVNDAGAGGIKLAGDTSTYHRNVYIGHNEIHEVGDGIVVHDSDAPLVEHNSGLNLGMGKYPFIAGNFAGMWPYNSRNTLFQHNVVGNSVTSTYDSTAWDCDINVVGPAPSSTTTRTGTRAVSTSTASPTAWAGPPRPT
ncbi:hypothetical protein [Paenarthrobacter sp. NPDC058040]|uniref:hypothetical protein n=1 Tax=Paenarthrobacter sp. NPDC058040 TaxID=3346309 RepID=UPI0036D9A36E